MKLSRYGFILFTLIVSTQTVGAAERLGQARLFLGSTQIDPKELNTELTTQGLKNVDLNNKFGVEITFPVMAYLNLGLRYSKHLISQDEASSNSSTDYKVEMNQDVMVAVARIPFYKTEYFVIDGVVGFGGSNTEYEIKTASQDGSLTKKGSPFATPYGTAGISLGVGKGKYFFVVEGGLDSNKVNDFDRSGNINSNVNEIDLSGSYLTLGLMFNGIPIFTK